MRVLVCDLCGVDINQSDRWSRIEDHQPQSVVEVKTYDLCQTCSPLLFLRKSNEQLNTEVDAVLREKGVLA